MKKGFTLAEVLLAVGIVGFLAVLIIPAVVTKYQRRTFEMLYDREVNAIESAINNIAVGENKVSFFESSMYRDETPSSYEDNAGKFVKKFLRVSKYCGDSNGDCFASKYYEYKNKDKVVYTPKYKGACAVLKNGVSICLQPQVGAADIRGILDINASNGPNIYGKDLREFSIKPKTRAGIQRESDTVLALDKIPITPACDSCSCNPTLPGCTPSPTSPSTPPSPSTPENPCLKDKNSLECCQKRVITDYTDACCTFSKIKNTNKVCTPPEPLGKCGCYWSTIVYSNNAANTQTLYLEIENRCDFDAKFSYTCTLATSNGSRFWPCKNSMQVPLVSSPRNDLYTFQYNIDQFDKEYKLHYFDVYIHDDNGNLVKSWIKQDQGVSLDANENGFIK